MFKKPNKNALRKAKHDRIRNELRGTKAQPRLNVYRSTTHIYAQIIDDEQGKTLCSASSLDKELAGKLAPITVKVSAKGGENGGKMFGSVTAEMIATALHELGFEIDKKKIEIKESIRDFGKTEVLLRLYPEVSQVLKIEVVRA